MRMADTLTIAGRTFTSRLFIGTAGYPNRQIMLDALAVTLGVGWVTGFAYFVADAAGLIAFDVNIAFLPALLGVVYLIAFVAGSIRYR